MYQHELKNIRTYKIYSIFNNLIILGPIITLFFLAKGLSFTEIFLLNSAAAITTVVFEVPTGAVGDYFGRKASLFIGSMLMFISLVVYIIAPSFEIMLIGEIVFAIGMTFRSGTEQALLYDSLKNNDMIKEYPTVEGQARSYTFYAQALGSVLAGFLYEYNIYMPFYFSCAFMIIAGIITLFFVEPFIESSSSQAVKYMDQIKISFRYAFKHKRVLSIILFSVVFMFFYRVGFNYFQPYMKAVNIPERYFGIIFFLFNIVAAYASKNAQKFIDKTKPRSLLMVSLLITVSFALLAFTKIWIGVIFILMQQLARGYRTPVFQKYINKRIPSDKRATIISIQNLAHSLVIAIFGPFAGMLLDNSDIFTSHFVMSVLMGILLLVANLYMVYASKHIELTQVEK